MTEQTKACPECGETILAVARRCKHCQANLGNESAAAPPIGAFRISSQPNPAGAVASIDDTDRLHVFTGLFVAFVPLSGLLLEYLVGLLIPDSKSLSWALWFFLNCVACEFDSKALRSAGYDTSSLQRWTIFLVPVYLYKRAKVCKPGLLWLWILCVIAPNMLSPAQLRSFVAGISTENKAVETKGIGEAVSTDKFEVVVDSVRSSKTILGLRAAEGAIYVAIEWRYKNISGRPISPFDVPEIHLIGPGGAKYDRDVAASALFAAEVGTSTKIISEINPGIRVKDADVFEIAKEGFNPSTWHVLIEAGSADVAVRLLKTQQPVVSSGSSAASAQIAESRPKPAVSEQASMGASTSAVATRVAEAAEPTLEASQTSQPFETPQSTTGVGREAQPTATPACRLGTPGCEVAKFLPSTTSAPSPSSIQTAAAPVSSATAAVTGTFSIPVSGRSNPWSQEANPTMPYSSDAFQPVVIKFDKYGILPGRTLSIVCTGGMSNAGGLPDTGCDGLKGMFPPSNDTYQPACKSYYPSKYQDPSTYDTWVFQVIGVFATADGVVVGKPFPISSKARTVQVPSGAVQLQLGMNDCLNGDNSPAPLTIQVSPSQASSTEGQPTITAGPADAVAAPKTSS